VEFDHFGGAHETVIAAQTCADFIPRWWDSRKLTYGTPEDIAVVRRYLDMDDLREAIENAPPGIFDARSWAYWNAMIDRYPAPPMPRRIIPDRP
jgi:hypothetical protein